MTSGANGTATSLSQEVLRYAAGVRAELADLTPAQRDDLLEDLEDHLSEVAAELDEPLQSRLGPPEVYAAELRASAGIAPAMPQPQDATSRMRQFWDSSVVRSVRGFLVELQPAWWVLRGLLLAIVLAAVFGPFAGFVFGIAAVVVSVLLGRRTRGRRGPWALSILVNVIAVIALLASGFAAAGGGSYAVVEEPYGSFGPAPGSLAHETGHRSRTSFRTTRRASRCPASGCTTRTAVRSRTCPTTARTARSSTGRIRWNPTAYACATRTRRS